jgi:hypothetical protein
MINSQVKTACLGSESVLCPPYEKSLVNVYYRVA